MGGIVRKTEAAEESGYRIVAVTAPGVAAEDAAHGKIEAFERAMLPERF